MGSVADYVRSSSLKLNTVFLNAEVSGIVWFDHKKYKEVVLTIVVGGITYDLFLKIALVKNKFKSIKKKRDLQILLQFPFFFKILFVFFYSFSSKKIMIKQKQFSIFNIID